MLAVAYNFVCSQVKMNLVVIQEAILIVRDISRDQSHGGRKHHFMDFHEGFKFWFSGFEQFLKQLSQHAKAKRGDVLRRTKVHSASVSVYIGRSLRVQPIHQLLELQESFSNKAITLYKVTLLAAAGSALRLWAVPGIWMWWPSAPLEASPQSLPCCSPAFGTSASATAWHKIILPPCFLPRQCEKREVKTEIGLGPQVKLMDSICFEVNE